MFKKNLAKAEKKKQEENVEFLRDIPYLSTFPFKFAVKLQMSLEKVNFPKIGMTAFKEGQPSDYICFVAEGEFEVIKEDLSKMDHRLFGFVEQDRNDQPEELAKNIIKIRNSSTVFRKSRLMLNAKKDTSLFPLLSSTVEPAKGIRNLSQAQYDHDDRVD
jgi:hypothetical protein